MSDLNSKANTNNNSGLSLDKPIDLESFIRVVPDFPKAGISFKDITPLLSDKLAFSYCIEKLSSFIKDSHIGPIDKIASPESRGFILGAALSLTLGTGFIPIRKTGKLPYKTFQASYALEYGSDSLYIHQDACCKGERVLIVDDILATSGTANACRELITKCEATTIGACFLGEIVALSGKNNIKDIPCLSLLSW